MKINTYLQSITPSVTLAISAQTKKMKAEGIPVIGFGAGEPDFDTPDYIKEAAIQAINDGFTRYTPATGIEDLKQAICDKLQRDNGLSYTPSNIVVSCGAKHTIFNVIQVLCNKGDEVVIPSPYWLSYPEMVKMVGAIPVVIDCAEDTQFKMTPKMLEAAITDKTRIVILNSPSNPTGMIYNKDELEALGAILVKHDVTIISDEIYEHIIYDKEHVSIASLSPELFAKTIVVNGHSKAYAMTGWRIGYMAGDAVIVKAMASYQSHSTANPCSIAQKAAVAALNGDQSFLTNNVRIFQERRDKMLQRLNEISGISCILPEGAFYAFPSIKGLGKGSSVEVAEALLKEAHVALVPGAAFGANDYVRLSYALSMEDMLEGLERIAKWVAAK